MNKSDAKVVELRPAATSEAPSRLLQQHSESRMKLARLVNSKLAAEERVRHLVEAAAALREATDAEGNARAALAALDAERSQAMAAWSKDPSGPMPTFDRAKREKLKAALEDAAEQAAAARGAASSINDQHVREAADLKKIEESIELAVATVIIEEFEPKVAAFQAALRDLANKRAEISAASERINLIGVGLQKPLSDQPNFEVAQPIFVALEDLNTRIRAAFAEPAPAIEDHRAALRGYAEKLRRDPIALLD
jgi:hypothetical protein